MPSMHRRHKRHLYAVVTTAETNLQNATGLTDVLRIARSVAADARQIMWSAFAQRKQQFRLHRPLHRHHRSLRHHSRLLIRRRVRAPNLHQAVETRLLQKMRHCLTSCCIFKRLKNHKTAKEPYSGGNIYVYRYNKTNAF